MTFANDVPVRRAARVLLLTPAHEVLLIHTTFPFLPAPVYVMPGGGLKAGESWEEAAVRELLEETGRKLPLGAYLCERTFPIETARGPMRQHERYFLVETARFEPAPHALTPEEQSWILGYRWCSLAALRSSADIAAGDLLYEAVAEALASARKPAL